MPTVKEIIHRLLPLGTAALGDPPSWERCPSWPPDVFGVAASLVNKSGCYAQPRYMGGAGCVHFFDSDFRRSVTEIADRWMMGATPSQLQDLWKTLVDSECEVAASIDQAQPWWDAALQLLAIADTASVGIGFLVPQQAPTVELPGPAKPTIASAPVRVAAETTAPEPQQAQPEAFPDFYLSQYKSESEEKGRSQLPHLPRSLCIRIPPEELCVQPKTVTAQVGCTLRSLSHHLALLPAVGEVTTWWHLETISQPAHELPLNLLLVPFPYRMDGNCFQPDPISSTTDPDARMRFFRVRQNWLRGMDPRRFADYLEELIETAGNEVETVHGIVLPEGALENRQAQQIAEFLAEDTALELFVTGVFDDTDDSSGCVSGVYSSIFSNGQIYRSWHQSKHHRWKLDRRQIQRYHLGHALDPTATWWERIRVSDRKCVFYVFRHGASLTTLVCEDLARIDPVQTAIRAVGPNLVIALLQDGPQLEKRWPGRYATVLADDPGSAVLTLTSLGMLRRSFMPGEDRECEIALWKEPYGVAQELKLPRGCQALLLTLTHGNDREWTIDTRSDGGGTIRLSLSGVRGIALSNHELEKWLGYHVGDW